MAHDESFFREVREDLRNERIKQLWVRFRVFIIALIVLIVVGTAAYVGYDYWNNQQAAKSGDQFLAALKLADDKKPDAALKALDQLEKTGHGDYPVLARMRAASIMANTGDAKAAIAAFSKIGEDESVPQVMRDAARIRAGYLLVDNGSYGQVADQVEALSGDDNPFRSSAREALGLAAWKAGDAEKAAKWFQQIADDGQAPANSASGARMMLDLIKASDKPEKQS